MDKNMIKSGSQEIKSSVKEKSFLVTATGEPYQIVRVHFSVKNKKKLLETLSRLRCFVYSRNLKQWKWFCKDEAQTFNFSESYALLSKKTVPLVLGTVQFAAATSEMFFDVISFERATKGIVFFDKYIKRSYARVTDIEVVNKLFEASNAWMPRHDDYFDVHETHKTLPEVLINRLSMIASSIDDPKSRASLSYSYLEKMAKEPLAEVERFPTYYYEDGIEKIQASLRMRHFIALQHWYGRTDYTFYDLSQEIISR